MSLLREGGVNADGLLFKQQFISRRYCMDATGVLVGCQVGRYGPGIMPTAASSRVTYDNTRALLINANKMTIRTRFRTGSSFASCVLLDKYDGGGTWPFGLEWFGVAGYLLSYWGAAANYSYPDAPFVASTEYVTHVVFDGTLAAGLRTKWYVAGLPVAYTVGGALPATIPAAAIPITIFNRYGGAASAPTTTFTLLDCGLWAKAFSAQECLLDATDTTF